MAILVMGVAKFSSFNQISHPCRCTVAPSMLSEKSSTTLKQRPHIQPQQYHQSRSNHGSQDTIGSLWSSPQCLLQHSSRQCQVWIFLQSQHYPFEPLLMIPRTARNSKPLEVLGTYSPYPKPPPDGEGPKQKSIQLDLTRAKYWLGVGAQPTDGAWDLLHKVRVIIRRYGLHADV